MLEDVSTEPFVVIDVPSEDVFEKVGDILFTLDLTPLRPWSSSGIDGLRKSPPTDARGLGGLAVSVLLPGLIGVMLTIFLTAGGDLPVDVEDNLGDGNFEAMTPERRFVLLLAFKGVLSGFVAIKLFPGASLVKDVFRGPKVFVEVRKSSGIASPL